MNVKELREALADLPDDLMVVVRGYEGGVSEVVRFQRYVVQLNVNEESYYGEHEKIESEQSPYARPLDEGAPTAPVVELAGSEERA